MATASKPKYLGPCWFTLSYDAGAKSYKDVMNESGVTIKEEKRKYLNNDFRKKIIRILRKKELFKVEIMDEPVETTIVFLDPCTNITMKQKLDYWVKEFSGIVKDPDFYFVIAPLVRYTGTLEPVIASKPNLTLQAGFQKLLEAVKIEEANK